MRVAFTLSTHEHIPADAAACVDAGLGAFNAQAAPLGDVRPLGTLAHDAAGQVVGGAVGRTWGVCCELQQIWVQPEWRGQGIGAQLLGAFHEAAQARGCRTFYLETFSFQAPGLYRRLGYEVKLAIDGYTAGIAKFTMVRELGAPLVAG